MASKNSLSIQVDLLSSEKAEALCRDLTQTLPHHFGLPEANHKYAAGVRSCFNLGARVNNSYEGLLCLEFPYPTNGVLYWMAVFPDSHRKGIGRKLIQAACTFAHEKGAQTLTVETLSPQEGEDSYLETYQFYKAMGFSPLFDLKPEECEWTMVYMIKSLGIQKEMTL